MSDDLVKRLRNIRGLDILEQEDVLKAADRIEELEAKLAKATEALLRIVRGDDDAHNWAIHKFACRWTLAELKGDENG